MFQVGDVITGKENSSTRYRKTNEHSVCTVVEVDPSVPDLICVRIDEHEKDRDFIGEVWRVSSEYFILYCPVHIGLEPQSKDSFMEMLDG
ncbi:hypothetical protein D7X33_16615 [Butyricicoccus sp. 1XD8-22]|nr:hypothetical protein D7X33_16615 [Butyricicoccus sp. 1XD8-22]